MAGVEQLQSRVRDGVRYHVRGVGAAKRVVPPPDEQCGWGDRSQLAEIGLYVRLPTVRRDQSLNSSRLARPEVASRPAATMASRRSGYLTIVSASPIAAMLPTTVSRDGGGISGGFAGSIEATIRRGPGGVVADSAGGAPTSISRRTRSGFASAYQMAQVPPAELPSRFTDSSPSVSRTRSSHSTEALRRGPDQWSVVGIAESEAWAVDRHHPRSSHPADEGE